MANSKRKCGYKPCGQFFKPESGNVGTVIYCSSECKILKFSTKPKAKPVVKKKRVKLKTLPRLIEDCAETLQRLVRVKAAVAANNGGYIKCVTCGKVDHFNNLQGGHFIERGKTSVKIIEEQVNPQCNQCNAWNMKKTSYVMEYRRFLVDTYGEKWVQDLIAQSKQVKKYTRAEVETLHTDYKTRLAELEGML